MSAKGTKRHHSSGDTNDSPKKLRTDTTPQQESHLTDEADDEDQYNFSHKQRGQMVLIVNDEFIKFDRRVGADHDLRHIQAIAKKLGFQIFNKKHTNLTKKETESVLHQAKKHDHSDCDCFMFVVSSHGEAKVNPLTGRTEHAFICSDDQFIFTSSVLDMFSDTNCPTLKNKPKMFFIQACRGKKLDHGVEVQVVKEATEEDKEDTNPTDHPDVAEPAAASPRQLKQSCVDSQDAIGSQDMGGASQTELEPDPEDEEVPDPDSDEEIPSFQLDHCDCLVMYASPAGHFAWRNEGSGSWMLNSLTGKVMSYDTEKPKDFLPLLNQVAGSMAERQANTGAGDKKHGAMAVPVIMNTLLKSIVFKTKALMKGPV